MTNMEMFKKLVVV